MGYRYRLYEIPEGAEGFRKGDTSFIEIVDTDEDPVINSVVHGAILLVELKNSDRDALKEDILEYKKENNLSSGVESEDGWDDEEFKEYEE